MIQEEGSKKFATTMRRTHKPKEDRYDRLNKSLILRESSFISNSAETTATITNEVEIPQKKQCRICLDDQDSSGGRELFSVCKCTGSVGHVHQQCFISWVSRTIEHKSAKQRKKIIEQGSECQLCKFPIPIKVQGYVIFSSCEYIKHKISKKPFFFFVYTTVEVLCIAVLSFLINMMFSMGLEFDSQKAVNSLILVCSFVVMLCLSIGISYWYVLDFFMEDKLVVMGFGDDKLNENKNEISQSPTLNRKDSSVPFRKRRSRRQVSNLHDEQSMAQIEIISQQPENVVHVSSSLQEASQQV